MGLETPRQELTREIAECRATLVWQQADARRRTGEHQQIIEVTCNRCEGEKWTDYDFDVDELLLRFIRHIRTKHPEATRG